MASIKNTLGSTAWMIAHRRTFTDIPYSKEIFNELEKILQSDGQEIPDEYKLAVLAPQIEARYKLINRLIKEYGAKQILEIASGLSPRGLEMTGDQAVVFTEVDMPDIIEQKRKIIGNITEGRTNLHLDSGTALNLESLKRATRYFDKSKPVVITHEGLLRYLSLEEKAVVARNIHNLLEEFDGIWITSDITLRSVLKDENRVTDNQVDKVLNKVTDLDVNKNSFESINDAEDFFGTLGFKVKQHSFIEMKDELVSPSKLNSTEDEVVRQLEGPCVFVMKI